MRERRARRLARKAARYGRDNVAATSIGRAVAAGDPVAVEAIGSVDQTDWRYEPRWLDQMWSAQLDGRGPVAWYLRARPRPVRIDRVYRALTALVVTPAAEVLTTEMRIGVACAAGLDHPVAAVARTKIRACLDPELVDEACLLAGDVPELAEFCRANDLSLSDEAKRARYLLLTHRFAEYQALDPDGALLQRAHRAATEPERAKLRQVLATAGATDLVRLLIRGGWQLDVRERVDDDLGWLARSYAERGDWPALWDLVTEASLVHATHLAFWFDGSWRPSGDADHRLFEAFRATSEEAVADAAADPTVTRRIPLDGESRPAAVAADGRRIAVAYPVPGATQLDLFDQSTGELLTRHRHPNQGVHIAVCGDGLLCGGIEGLVRYTDQGRELLHDEPVLGLTAASGTFAAVTPGKLLLGSSDTGSVPYRLTRLGVPQTDRVRACAMTTDGEKIAVASSHAITVVSSEGEMLAKRRPIPAMSRVAVLSLAFVDRSQLVAIRVSPDELRLDGFLMSGQELETTTSSTIANNGRSPTTTRPLLAAVPERCELVVRRLAGRYELLDATTFEPAATDLGWTALFADHPLLPTPAGPHTLAVAKAVPYGQLTNRIELHDLRRAGVLHLLDEPLSTLKPSDLRAAAELDDAVNDPCARLLRTCLERRFGTDVQLHRHGRAGAHDIALGEAT